MMNMSLYFKLIPVEEKPLNRYSKEMYKELIQEFLSKDFLLAEVLIDVNNKSYVKAMLIKCLEEMNLEHKLVVSIVNNKCFLERF